MPQRGPTSHPQLKKAGLRRTPVRVAILDLLSRSEQPLGVTQILSSLPPGTDMVTVYRTLNKFTQLRLLHRVRAEDRSWRYATGQIPSRAEHGHAHFVCERCGKVECLSAARIPRGLVGSLRLSRRYSIRFPELILHGTCPGCK